MKHLFLIFTCVFIFASPMLAQKASKHSKVDLAKKIADATPEALPQEPKEPRIGSDALDAGLKGKVKSVIEYTSESGSRNRTIYKEEYFDADGNFTKTVDYDEGYPSYVTVWGYIDKMRVNRSSQINYAEGEKPPSKYMSITVRAEDNSLNPNAPRDRRYDMRHRYTYDQQGRLIETAYIQNSGELWHRNGYTYEGNKRIERDFDNRGRETSKTAETLDAHGHVMLRELYGAGGKVSDTHLNTFDVDPQGNWTIERTYEETKLGKRKVRKLRWTSYRTITYYP